MGVGVPGSGVPALIGYSSKGFSPAARGSRPGGLRPCAASGRAAVADGPIGRARWASVQTSGPGSKSRCHLVAHRKRTGKATGRPAPHDAGVREERRSLMFHNPAIGDGKRGMRRASVGLPSEQDGIPEAKSRSVHLKSVRPLVRRASAWPRDKRFRHMDHHRSALVL